jgi:SAM domain (Sterile alpha motif)
MLSIREWLHSLGLSEYAELFAENRIDLSILRDLTDQDLKDLGIVLGDRRRLLRAISELAGTPSPARELATTPVSEPREEAERRGGRVHHSRRLVHSAAPFAQNNLVADPAGLVARALAILDESNTMRGETPPLQSQYYRQVSRRIS